MPLPNAKEKLIQQGAFCNVVIYDDNYIKKTHGLVQNASYNEDFNVVAAQVLGFFGPVSLDAQNYSCSLTLGTFVPLKPREEITVPYLDGGETTIQQQLKTRSEVALTGKGTVITQIDFTDKQGGTIYNSFNQCIITSNGVTIGAAAYVTANIQLMCIERTI
jgi:hypothetical protein